MDKTSRTASYRHKNDRVAATGLFLIGLLTVACGQQPSTRGDLSALDLPDTRILAVEEIADDEDTPAHTKVTVVIGKEINLELLLPADWNGKFLMGGGGGFVGSVQNQALGEGMLVGGDALDRGYATVGTDTGHAGSGIAAVWALNNLEREINFGHRAVHLTAETAKVIIRHHYGGEISRSYFLGCSRGGGQGMMESQRYPNDFDGIIVGAPAYEWPGIGAGFIQTQQAIYPNPQDAGAPVITPENRELLASGVVGQCDALDGVEDGVVGDPRNCPFDVDDLPRCSGDAPGAECVTAAQLAAIKSVYEGPKSGDRQIFPGFPFGGETEQGGWAPWIVGGGQFTQGGIPSLHYAFGTEMYKYLVFDDPDWDYTSYDFSTYDGDTAFIASILNATDTDLSSFKGHGGKMIMFQGWSDSAITALGTIEYYEAVAAKDPGVRDYFRLFMMPGVLHCAGGAGPDRVDYIAAIEDWVENGEAPDSLLASHFDGDGNVDRTRPLCPYPEVAVYNGSGSTDDAANFQCASPQE